MPDENLLLLALSPADRARIASEAATTPLLKGHVLFDAGDEVRQVYFPTAGLLSVLAVTPNGHAVELAMVGCEGFIGLPLLLDGTRMPYQVVVQLPGAAIVVERDTLRSAFQRVPAFRRGLLANGRARQRQVCQAVICHRFHPLAARVSRWLLSAGDRTASDTIPCTQQALAYVLNAARTAVTAVAVELHSKGLIEYRHGRITITNRDGLAARACPCYRLDEWSHAPVASSVQSNARG